jgi:GTP-binding protein
MTIVIQTTSCPPQWRKRRTTVAANVVFVLLLAMQKTRTCAAWAVTSTVSSLAYPCHQTARVVSSPPSSSYRYSHRRATPSEDGASDTTSRSDLSVTDKVGDDNPTYYSPNRPLQDFKSYAVTSADGNAISDSDQSLDSLEALSSSVNEYSFFDEAILYVRGGSGGQGSSTYKKAAGGQNGQPDGGNGGQGGNVILQVDVSLNTLAGLTQAWRPNSFGGSGAAAAPQSTATLRPKSFRAENGSDGDRQFKNGRYGKDVYIRVPPGTVVQEEISPGDYRQLGSLTEVTDELVVAQGGQGGEGTGVQGRNRGVRRPRIPATGGDRKVLKLTLKIVADVALVGVPNAGKSTFLAAVTRAKPKIANYPFTTVIPNLGVWIPGGALEEAQSSQSDKGAGSEGLVLCDVPGLIAGAAQGVGLGHAFLRHVERCHVILHLIDATSNDPAADYEMLNREIVKYGTGQLAQMPQVVVINKIDAFEGAKQEWEEGLEVKWARNDLERKMKESMPHSRLMWMSAREREGVDDLMSRLASFVKKVKAGVP